MAAATAYKVGKLIDGTGGPVIDNGVVVIEDGRIVSAGPETDVAIPNGAEIVEEPALTAMPGMMDLDRKSVV